MNHIKQLYEHSLSLLTDLYQLTMAYGYWKTNTINKEAVFTLFFRKQPFYGGYTIAAGLETVLEYLEDLHFTKTDLDYLATLMGSDDKPLFEQAFLDYLGKLRFECDIDAMPEGTVVFPHEPLLRVQGPLLQCQLLETALLNIVNFQTLITTKAARVCQATQGEPVLEFGLRRAQGIDGALTASRAAYIGGCAGTSNVLAGKLYGIPVKGTHAHSWIMSFDSEDEAFRAYAEAMPNNCIFLVDTFNTIEGIKKAIKMGQWLQENDYQLIGIRLDSGNFVSLSQKARQLLDEAGFKQTRIVASNDLDELTIANLKAAGAKIDLWGVGTKLITSYDQPALGGVYKLTAIRDSAEGEWQHRLKISEEPAKTSNPGLLQVRRFSDSQQNEFICDMIYNQLQPPIKEPHLVSLNAFSHHPDLVEGHTTLPKNAPYQDLLIPVVRKGEPVIKLPSLTQIRQHLQEQLAHCHESIKRLDMPETYPVHLEMNLYYLKQKLIDEARHNEPRDIL
ncbi:nicotinate phosphoribosyltransferase [Candidatus Parabeggiatoa sp. HSG14]|uniref:nicotinate phosphoribosyltransferase n=1 Tax=Candidatus Parabeggiatoa sp. HSG14 TaxID=3055593 RepID=UPI0025A7263B|nr:nicotinate phosphoribosyltransferase [Thiotrichales bacterium HSG14]